MVLRTTNKWGENLSRKSTIGKKEEICCLSLDHFLSPHLPSQEDRYSTPEYSSQKHKDPLLSSQLQSIFPQEAGLQNFSSSPGCILLKLNPMVLQPRENWSSFTNTRQSRL